MARYEFLTTWLIDAPREEVYNAIWDSESWPSWWEGVDEARESDPGSACGIGRRGGYVWRGRIPYRVRFEVVSKVVEPPHLLVGEASGDLAGTGCWRFYEDGGVTAALYEWNVTTTKPWMNAVAPLAGPVFRWSHDGLMQRGGEGLARLLGARLLASS
ncbi:MAG: SRPBCC family protein [Solirubrobacterales bacterium]